MAPYKVKFNFCLTSSTIDKLLYIWDSSLRFDSGVVMLAIFVSNATCEKN